VPTHKYYYSGIDIIQIFGVELSELKLEGYYVYKYLTSSLMRVFKRLIHSEFLYYTFIHLPK